MPCLHSRGKYIVTRMMFATNTSIPLAKLFMLTASGVYFTVNLSGHETIYLVLSVMLSLLFASIPYT